MTARSCRRRFLPAVVLAGFAGVSALATTGATTASAASRIGTLTPVRTQQQMAGDYAGSGQARQPGAQQAANAAANAVQGVTGSTIPVGLLGVIHGIDVASYQGNVDWNLVHKQGIAFTYIKATEALDYQNPYYLQGWLGAPAAGLIRGSYHFAIPNISSGTAQADFFVNHGGAWSPDGYTLPPMLDMEYNPDGPTCYGLSQSAMASWVLAFSNEVHAKTGRYPTIYAGAAWWKLCTGNSTALSTTNPLYVAHWGLTSGPVPGGWKRWTIWQYSNKGRNPGTQEVFYGNRSELIAFAKG